jgi:hypothetical protein
LLTTRLTADSTNAVEMIFPLLEATADPNGGGRGPTGRSLDLPGENPLQTHPPESSALLF